MPNPSASISTTSRRDVPIELGASLAIDTDAHSVDELRFMRWGVDRARHGWVERRHVMKTFPLETLLATLRARRP